MRMMINLIMKINKKNNFVLLIFAILVSLTPGIIGSLFTVKSIESWYIYLNKPSFNPPNWLFSPVWTTLYILIGISLFLILKNKDRSIRYKNALILFSFHLVLNASWSIIFFEIRSLLLAFINIILLCIVVLFCIINFYKIDKKAAYLLIPYLLWISFASYLNLAILLLN